MLEESKIIIGHENYLIYNTGKVYSKKTNKFLKSLSRVAKSVGSI